MTEYQCTCAEGFPELCPCNTGSERGEMFEAFVRRVAPEHAPLILAEVERLRQELRIAQFDAVVPVRELREENERLREDRKNHLRTMDSQEDENKRLREALECAVYHAENLQRVRNYVPVRDLDESSLAFLKARKLVRE